MRSLSPGTCLRLRFARRSTGCAVSNQCKIQSEDELIYLYIRIYSDIMHNLFIESVFKVFCGSGLWFVFSDLLEVYFVVTGC